MPKCTSEKEQNHKLCVRDILQNGGMFINSRQKIKARRLKIIICSGQGYSRRRNHTKAVSVSLTILIVSFNAQMIGTKSK